jgi:hypothetical protein
MNEAEPLTTAPAKKRGSGRRWLFVAVLVLLPVLLLAGIYFYIAHLADLGLQEALAEADRLDPGWRLDDLLSRRAQYADDDNSALQAARSKSLIPNRWAAKQEFNDLFADLPKQHQLDPALVKALGEEMAKAATALAEARKLADMPHGRFPLQWAPDSISTIVHCQDAREAANLLHFDVLLLAQEGDLDAALRSTRGIVNAGRTVGDEPTLVSQLVRFACRAVAVGSLERVLAQGEPAPEALADLQRFLEEEEKENLYLCGVRGERAGMDHLMANLQNGTVKLQDFLGPRGLGVATTPVDTVQTALVTYSPSNLKSQRADMLRLMTQLVETAKLPPEQQPEQNKQFDLEIRRHGLLVRLLMPAVIKVAEANQRSLAQLRCAITALAVERYRRAHGGWPASLDALVADGLLQRVPTDPYDGAPLRYRVRDDRVVIYSIARDLEDNGGTFDGKAGYTKGTDSGFTLWNLSHRRLLPLPAVEPPVAEPMPGEPAADAASLPAPKEPRK